MALWSWSSEELSDEYVAWHEEARRECQRDIVQMTHLAGSGHPGGSLSSLDFYLLLYSHARLRPDAPWDPERDRILVSHGHTSPGVYAVLGYLGFFPRDEAIAHFRKVSNVFEGHVEREVPGVEWTTGNLGQGLSAGCGLALGQRLHGRAPQVYVPMGDGEQQKGQISEARRFAVKYGLHNVTAIIDRNRLQIGGDTDAIMPQDIVAGWKSDGWQVNEVDGHDPRALYRALRLATLDRDHCHVVVADTIMGKGIGLMEGKADFHGRSTTPEEYEQVVAQSGEDPRLWDPERLRSLEASPPPPSVPELPLPYPEIAPGTPFTYGVDQKTDNRSSFGKALLDVAQKNRDGAHTPLAVFDCDLEGSVKVSAFRQEFPRHFFEAGIQEHHTAVCAGALSTQNVATVFADFGIFGITETYNQHRLTDINHGNVKLVSTHLGLDVGEDGKTHQCIDYLGLLHNLFGAQAIIPADPNQTDRAFRYLISRPGMHFLGMGRSKLPVIATEAGEPFFGGDYEFEPGRGDWIRRGQRVAVVVMGTLTGRALQCVEALRGEGHEVGLAHLATPLAPGAEFLEELASFECLVTVEDHNVRTGLGAALASALFARGHLLRHLRLGVERYCPSGSAESVFASQGLDAAGLERRIREFIA